MTPEQLKQILPLCKEPIKWFGHLENAFEKYKISNPAMFLAQVGHESAHLNVVSENLNYSSQALRKVFGKYFPTEELANQYARQPEKIANRVYANRMDNGPETSGDGWKYRGRGILQITGTFNYRECSLFLFGDHTLLENPDLLLEKKYAIESACWFWYSRKLNVLNNIETVSKIVNGGLNGIEDRKSIYERAKKVLDFGV